MMAQAFFTVVTITFFCGKFNIRDLDLLRIGMVNDMYAEKGCNARSIKEVDSQDAIVSALNSCICDREEMLTELKETMRVTVENSNAAAIEQLVANMKKLQKKIISMPEGQSGANRRGNKTIKRADNRSSKR